MSRLLLQPKTTNLRLNLEQVQHVTDGLVENRKNIASEHIELYDSQMEDIFHQLGGQGIKVEYDLDDVSGENEAIRAELAIKLIRHKALHFMPEGEHRDVLLQNIDDLDRLLFG